MMKTSTQYLKMKKQLKSGTTGRNFTKKDPSLNHRGSMRAVINKKNFPDKKNRLIVVGQKYTCCPSIECTYLKGAVYVHYVA
jgi:hypothetical protein